MEPVLTYGSETIISRGKERSRIRVVQMDNRVLLYIRRMDKVLNARIRQSCGVSKGVNEKIGRSSPMVRPCGENDRIAKRVYVGECAGSRSVSRPRKRWIDTVKDYLKKRGLDVRQARRMVHDISVW